jgi:16S rRNA (cytosine1402-N4)-methyltransferase
MRDLHQPVMAREVIEKLHVKRLARYIDATVGTGGHAAEIMGRGGVVLGIDADFRMLEIARKNLGEDKVTLVGGNFRDIDRLAAENGFDKVDGILFDLGISSVHLDSDERGFSFRKLDAPLDMRLDPERQNVSAADLLNSLREDQLRELFSVTGVGGLARKVVEQRKAGPIRTVGDFIALMGEGRHGKLHPATKAFLALRIAVNSELISLKEALPKAYELLEPGGRMAVISFHSGEDSIVKRAFGEFEEKGFGKSEGLVRPLPGEIEKNPRARSAVMRIFRKGEV